MSDLENQMGLFEIGGPAPKRAADEAETGPAPSYSPPAPRQPAQPKPAAKAARPAARNRAGSGTKTPPRTAHPPPQKGVSGLVPEGDVRLTANIRQDLHLKLKIASAYRRTTIGEIIEELIEKYV